MGRIHYDNDSPFSSPCGRPRGVGEREREDLVTNDLGKVTCRICRRRAEELYASRRDGIDYRRLRWEEARERAAHKREAQRIVLARHAEEVEMELALIRLAHYGATA